MIDIEAIFLEEEMDINSPNVDSKPVGEPRQKAMFLFTSQGIWLDADLARFHRYVCPKTVTGLPPGSFSLNIL